MNVGRGTATAGDAAAPGKAGAMPERRIDDGDRRARCKCLSIYVLSEIGHAGLRPGRIGRKSPSGSFCRSLAGPFCRICLRRRPGRSTCRDRGETQSPLFVQIRMTPQVLARLYCSGMLAAPEYTSMPAISSGFGAYLSEPISEIENPSTKI